MKLIVLLPWITFAMVFFMVLMTGIWLVRKPNGNGNGNGNGHGRGRKRPLLFGPLTSALAGVIPLSSTSRTAIDRELRRAGYYHPQARDEFLALRNALVVGAVLVAATWMAATADMSQRMTFKIVLGGAIIAALCFAIPRLYLQWYGNRRIQQIQRGLPDALDILTMCLTGGLPLQSALGRINGQMHEAHPQLARELDILRLQSDAGSLEHALEQFAFRVDAPEIRTLTSLVGHAERLGTNVGYVIREYADGLRRSQRQRAEERGNRMTVQMLFPIALCLAPAVYIMLLGPPVLEMRDFLLRENRSGGILAPADLSQTGIPQTAPGRAPARQGSYILDQRNVGRSP